MEAQAQTSESLKSEAELVAKLREKLVRLRKDYTEFKSLIELYEKPEAESLTVEQAVEQRRRSRKVSTIMRNVKLDGIRTKLDAVIKRLNDARERLDWMPTVYAHIEEEYVTLDDDWAKFVVEAVAIGAEMNSIASDMREG